MQYVFDMPSNWGNQDTYLFWRCFYICSPSAQPIDSTNAETRSGASFTVAAPEARPPPPR